MPAVLNAVVSTNSMTTITSRADSNITHTTASSSSINNNDASSHKQDTASTTKYIQLQTVRPQFGTNMPVTMPATTALVSQRSVTNVLTPGSTAQRPAQATLPPGNSCALIILSR